MIGDEDANHFLRHKNSNKSTLRISPFNRVRDAPKRAVLHVDTDHCLRTTVCVSSPRLCEKPCALRATELQWQHEEPMQAKGEEWPRNTKV